MTDGEVKLLLRPRDNSLCRGLREGLDRVQSGRLKAADNDLEALAASSRESAARKVTVGTAWQGDRQDFQKCCLGQHFIADPDGALVDLSET